jgi:hypothetical protein
MLAQVLHQCLHFFDVLLCHTGPPMDLIKDETAQLVKGVYRTRDAEGVH